MSLPSPLTPFCVVVFTLFSFSFLLFLLLSPALDALSREGNTTREYTEALEVVPHLVHNETDRLKFLRADDFDATRAARRLAMYWKYRKVVFGKRWLLPMVQTGAGALAGEAIELLRKGFITLLSDPDADDPVILIDATRRSGPTADHTVASIAFYFATTVADERFQTKGVTLFYLIAERAHWNMSPNPTGYWKVVHEAMPMRIKKILMVPYHDPGKQHLLDYLSFQTSRLVESRAQRSSEIVAADSLPGTIQALERMGISQTILPQCLGGSFDDMHVHNWIRSRISLEDAMSAASPILNQIHAPRGSSAVIIKRKKPCSSDPDEPHDEESKKDYIRQRNALYSRRKYHKEKLEKISLEEQIKSLTQRNTEFRRVNEHLTGLINQANAAVLSLLLPLP